MQKNFLAGVGAFLFLLLLSVLLPQAELGAAGATLYVSKSAGVDTPDCGSGGQPCRTIQYAIDKALDDTTIQIAAGYYKENLKIEKGRIALIGAGKTTTVITAADKGNPAIYIANASVYLSSFTAQKATSASGIACEGARIEGELLLLQLNYVGVALSGNSTAALGRISANQNTGFGVNLSGNSTAYIENSYLNSNQGPGIIIGQSSTARLYKCTLKNNNLTAGGAMAAVSVLDSSNVNLEKSTISDNHACGLGLQTSSARLAGGNTIANNGDPSLIEAWRVGISASFNSHLSIMPYPPGSPQDIITGNNSMGIFVNDNSSCIINGIISQNQGDGVRLAHNSSAMFDPATSITNNTGYGINGTDSAGNSRYSGNPGVNSGNTLGNVNCPQF